MAKTRDIEKAMKEANYNLWDLVELGIDREEELLEEIARLEKEISDHSCS